MINTIDIKLTRRKTKMNENQIMKGIFRIIIDTLGVKVSTILYIEINELC